MPCMDLNKIRLSLTEHEQELLTDLARLNSYTTCLMEAAARLYHHWQEFGCDERWAGEMERLWTMYTLVRDARAYHRLQRIEAATAAQQAKESDS